MKLLAHATLVLVGCGRSGFDALPGPGAGGDGSLLDDAGGSPDDVNSPLDDASSATGDAPGDGPPATLLATFTNLAPASPPVARRSSSAASASDDRIWTFGGFAGAAGVRDDLAVYTPGTNVWALPGNTGTPAARERHVLSWDASQNLLVLFGGQTGSFPLFTNQDQLFLFDPGAGSWAQVPKAGNWPGARRDAHMVWVPSLNQTLLYGGNDGSGSANRFSDLWLLTVTSATAASWTLLSPGGVAPPPRSSACVAFDPGARRLIVYGGETQDGADTNTTYQYLVDTNVWQQDTPSGTTPPGESFMQCAWDPGIGRVVLYGGQNNSGVPIDGTYTYDPSSKVWDTIALGVGSPSPGSRSDGGAVYSAALGGMFWFGGRIAQTTYSNESWFVDL